MLTLALALQVAVFSPAAQEAQAQMVAAHEASGSVQVACVIGYTYGDTVSVERFVAPLIEETENDVTIHPCRAVGYLGLAHTHVGEPCVPTAEDRQRVNNPQTPFEVIVCGPRQAIWHTIFDRFVRDVFYRDSDCFLPQKEAINDS